MSNQHVIPVLGTKSEKTCDSCLHRIPGQDGNNWGAPATPDLCGVKDRRPVTLTIMPKEVALSAKQMIGGTCPKFNDTGAVSTPAGGEIPVALPLRLIDPATIPSAAQRSCTDCKLCENYMPEELSTTLGFQPGYGQCVAKGNLVKSSMTPAIAQRCDVRRRGQNVDHNDLLSIKYHPEYNSTHIKAYVESQRGEKYVGLPEGYDPLTYVHPTLKGRTIKSKEADKPDLVIRTWVSVFDPEGTGNSIDLPVFDHTSFPAEERVKVPQSTDDERPDLYQDWAGHTYEIAVLWMALDESPTLWGAAGVGKTELLRYIAWVMQIPFERINVTASTDLDDLQGYGRFENNETIFYYGRLARGWGKPNIICLDEPNTGPREVWQFIRPLTDNSKQLVIDANKGERILRNDFCFPAFAMNPAWDPKNDGANELADADIRRLAHINMELPPPEVERSIMLKRCEVDGWTPPDAILDMVLKIGADIRAVSASNDLPISWGVGLQIKAIRYLRWFDAPKAYKLAAADSMDPEIARQILVSVQTNSIR